MNKHSLNITFASVLLLVSSICSAAEVTIPMHLTASKQQAIGSIKALDTKHGLKLIPHLKDLPPGKHGFHIHDQPNCGDKGLAAGGHYDPHQTGHHNGPYHTQNGHLGDLPIIIVNKNGIANVPTIAPRLTVNMIKNHAVMIHEGGDNYSDQPEKLGGGGGRIACGIVPK